jgi:hypothetical protein
MIAPHGSQRNLQTITQWRYCHGCCRRSAPMRTVAGDTIWQCPWCGYHEPEPVQASAPSAGAKEAPNGQ